jgi:hypothetical protein
MGVAVAALEAPARRAVADNHRGAGQVEAEQGLKVLFHSHPPDREKDRPRQVERAPDPRTVEGVVDAARPHPDPREAAPGQIGADSRRRGHDRGRGRVKSAQPRIGEGFGHTEPRRDVFGKAGVVAGGERAFAPQTIAPRQPADGAFGGDMNVVRRCLLDLAVDPPKVWEREANLGVGRQRGGPHALRGEEFEFGAEFGRRLGHPLQGRHDAVDLRSPGVCRDQDAHHAASACASCAVSSSNETGSSTRGATSRRVFQCNTSNRPSQCSTTSEHDSTKSPVLT